MKKLMASVLSLAMVLCLIPMTAFAYEGEAVPVSYTHTFTPTYTLTIPASIEISKEGTNIEFTVSDANLANLQYIYISVATTSYGNGLPGLTAKEGSLAYSIKTSQFGTLGGSLLSSANMAGKNLLVFGNGSNTQTLVFTALPGEKTIPATYNGTITFGVEVKQL